MAAKGNQGKPLVDYHSDSTISVSAEDIGFMHYEERENCQNQCIVLFVPLFTKVFHLSDITILSFTFLDKIATTIIMGLARSNIALYIGCFVSIITNITIVALRSMATKAVSEEDLGKAQSLFGIFEAIGIATLTPLINMVFTATLDDFPAAFIFIETIVYIGCLLLLALSFYLRKYVKTILKNPADTTENKTKVEDVQTTRI